MIGLKRFKVEVNDTQYVLCSSHVLSNFSVSPYLFVSFLCLFLLNVSYLCPVLPPCVIFQHFPPFKCPSTSCFLTDVLPYSPTHFLLTSLCICCVSHVLVSTSTFLSHPWIFIYSSLLLSVFLQNKQGLLQKRSLT